MKRLFVIHLALLLAVAASIGTAQGSAQAEKLLASAQRKATIDGDLKGAIEEYKKAIAAAGGNRTLVAQALLRMAECHQKLGEGEAHEVYARIVREYADQKDAVVLARARLGRSSISAPVKADRSVWTGRDADGFGTISPDGRFLTFADWYAGAALALRDLTTGTNHRLTSGGSTQFSVISKDGKFVAYQWRDASTPANVRGYALHVARLHESAISQSRRLVDNDELDIAPFDWSPDGKWIAAGVSRQDGTNQIGLVSAQDGSLRILKSLDWKEPSKIFFSPDGKFIAYDLPVSETGTETHVFVMAIDGSREMAAAAYPSQNVIMGWSPDGRSVLFSSDRTGTFGLWTTPIEDGRPVGPSTLIKPDIASSWSLGLSASGTMYVWKYASPVYVQASPIDLTTGKLVSSSNTFQRFIGSRGRPAWSQDGKHLAYQSCDPLGAGPCTLWIRSMDSGELRELKVKLGYFFVAQWSPDGRELLTRGRDLKGRNGGFYKIDTQTGEVRLVMGAPPGTSMPMWAPDGRHVHYRRDAFLIERHLESGVERHLAQLPPGASRDIAVSPDGRHVAYILPDGSDTSDLFVMQISGEAQSVMRASAPERIMFGFNWTADGRALVVVKERSDTGKRQLWLAPLTGDKPRKLDIDVDSWRIEDGFDIDRAGKQIAFVAAAGEPGLEIRALENFLPAQTVGPTSQK